MRSRAWRGTRAQARTLPQTGSGGRSPGRALMRSLPTCARGAPDRSRAHNAPGTSHSCVQCTRTEGRSAPRGARACRAAGGAHQEVPAAEEALRLRGRGELDKREPGVHAHVLRAPHHLPPVPPRRARAPVTAPRGVGAAAGNTAADCPQTRRRAWHGRAGQDEARSWGRCDLQRNHAAEDLQRGQQVRLVELLATHAHARARAHQVTLTCI